MIRGSRFWTSTLFETNAIREQLCRRSAKVPRSSRSRNRFRLANDSIFTRFRRPPCHNETMVSSMLMKYTSLLARSRLSAKLAHCHDARTWRITAASILRAHMYNDEAYRRSAQNYKPMRLRDASPINKHIFNRSEHGLRARVRARGARPRIGIRAQACLHVCACACIG